VGELQKMNVHVQPDVSGAANPCLSATEPLDTGLANKLLMKIVAASIMFVFATETCGSTVAFTKEVDRIMLNGVLGGGENVLMIPPAMARMPH